MQAAPSFSAEISRTVYRAAQEMRKPVVEAVEARDNRERIERWCTAEVQEPL